MSCRRNRKSLPIEPVKQTKRAAGIADALEAVDQPIELTSNAQNFEHYVLPSTQLLTPPAPPIEQKDDDLRTAAADALREDERV
jgi:hypothetical protein